MGPSKKAANTSRAVENTAVSGYKATSNNSIAQTSEKSNTPEENNSDAVDWEGNRKERLSVSDEEAWKNRDIRFSPSEDADEIDWNGKETEETDSSASLRSAQNDRVEDLTAGMGATSSASQSEAPSPQGEGSGRQIAGATSGDDRQVAGATSGNGWQIAGATVENGGRQSAVPASDKEGRNRNKESVWIHQLIPYSILFILCCLLHITF